MKVDYTSLTDEFLKSGGCIRIPVIGGSMSPLLRSGDLIYARPAKVENLSAGDIVLCKKGKAMVAHRLVSISNENGEFILMTKGDAFPVPDDPVRGEEVVGKVYAVGKRGKMLYLDGGIPFSGKSGEETFIISALKSALPGAEPCDETVESLEDIARAADTERVAGTAREHKVAQALYLALKGCMHSASSPVAALIRELRRDYITTAAKNTLLYAEFGRVVKRLGEHGIEVLAMKGAALAELVYRDIGAREMSDVDLLIKRQELEKANAVLEELGYRSEDVSCFDAVANDKNYLTTRDYRSRDPRSPSFHIHWHMVNSSIPAPYAQKVDMDKIWADAVPVEIAGVRVFCMAPHHFLIHLCEHAMRATHSAARLVYLLDIAALAARYGTALDWRRVVEDGRDFGVERFLYNVLELGRARIGIDPPGWVMEELSPPRRGAGERVFHALSVHGHAFPGLSYLVHVDMNEGILNKALFVFRTLFPPVWVLAKKTYYPGEGGHAQPSFPVMCRLYAGRLCEVLRAAAAFPLRSLKKIGSALIACILALSFVAGIPADARAVERNSTYSMESGTPEYLLAPGDILEVRVWRGFEEKKYETVVNANGLITVGFVEVKAGDLTVRQAEAVLEKALLAYIKEPKVEITVKEYRGRTASILGAVQSQAKEYALKGKTTLTRMVIMAGGFTKDADIENVRITKADGSKKKVNLFLIMFGGDNLQDIVIDGGDTVYIPSKPEGEEKNFFIFGEVNSPGAYKFSPGLTLMQALGLAKGYKNEAILEEIRILRAGAEKPQLIAANAREILEGGDITKDVPLQKNDIIFVPRTKVADWNAFLSKLRPSLEILLLPFGGALIIDELFRGK
ncbi:MAG TPA: signal peptidase I [Dissulfurispiraceae bacterium]